MAAVVTEGKAVAVRRTRAGRTAGETTGTAMPTAKKADGAVMAELPRSGMYAATAACVRADGRNLAADLPRRNADGMSKMRYGHREAQARRITQDTIVEKRRRDEIKDIG